MPIDENLDGVIDYYVADVVSAQDYYPFGMLQPGRSFNAGGYRYGFNGQERSTEIHDNSYTAEYWEYDSRIGRRWNVDPVVKAWESGYACFSDNPIFYVDINGDEPEDPKKKKDVYLGKDGKEEIGNPGDVIVRATIHDKAEGERAKKAGFRDALFSDMVWGSHSDPRDLYGGDKWLQTKYAVGAFDGHLAAITIGALLEKGGEGMITGGLEGAVITGGETMGIGAAAGLGVALAGAGVSAYGGTLIAKGTAGVAQVGIVVRALSSHGNPQSNGSSGSGSGSVSPDRAVAEQSALADRTGKRGFTEVGYQFQKHFSRKLRNWHVNMPSGKPLNPSTYNDAGYATFREIWEGPGTFQNNNGFIEKRLPDGRGIRLQGNGLFKGFLD